MSLTTPVLLIGFNRPDRIKHTLQTLKHLGVVDLYVSLDGPRDSFDSALCEKVLNVVKSFKPYFRMKIIHRSYNLGCMLGVLSAIDWFFENVEFGVIVEDDFVPKQDCFIYFENFKNRSDYYCQRNVLIASSHNPFIALRKESISQYTLIGCWATYADVWFKVRQNYFGFNFPKVKNNFQSRSYNEAIFWWANSTRAKLGRVNTWDGIFFDQVWRLGIKTLVPLKNLSDHLGAGIEATHTKDPNWTNIVQLPKSILSNDFDFLMKEYYYKIKFYHLLTPFIRVLFDLLYFPNKKNFDKILIFDKNNRTTLS